MGEVINLFRKKEEHKTKEDERIQNEIEEIKNFSFEEEMKKNKEKEERLKKERVKNNSHAIRGYKLKS